VAEAKAIAWAAKKPLVGVHHIEGHVSANDIEHPDLEPPFVCLIVSGGHTHLVVVKDYGEFEILGRTRDDAAGEAFDKTAKLLGLPYPGGPVLAKLAEQGRPDVVKFPRPMLHSGDLDFSFSGLKTAVLTKVREIGEPDDQQRADIACGFQDAIVEVLVKKSMRAVKDSGLKQLVVAGGVGANRELRRQLDAAALRARITVYYPELEFCTDNGAMIALAGALRFQAGVSTKPAGAFAVRPRWPLAELTNKG
jgi:N6-L-threonylcarbamoyladenine synthase